MPTIVPCQASWPEEFEAIAARLRAGLGTLALRVESLRADATGNNYEELMLSNTEMLLRTAYPDRFTSSGGRRRKDVERTLRHWSRTKSPPSF